MEHYNNPWAELEDWFFADNESLAEACSSDGVTMADRVGEFGTAFAHWAEYDYWAGKPLVIDPLHVLDVITLESSLIRVLDTVADQRMLLEVWVAWADRSTAADTTAGVWARGELILALWELEKADLVFPGSHRYTKILDAELGCLDRPTLRTMPTMLAEQLAQVRNCRRAMLAAEAQARKNQPTLFDDEDDRRS